MKCFHAYGKRRGIKQMLKMCQCHATVRKKGRILERLLQEVVNNNKRRTWQQGEERKIVICCN